MTVPLHNLLNPLQKSVILVQIQPVILVQIQPVILVQIERGPPEQQLTLFQTASECFNLYKKHWLWSHLPV